MTTTAHEDQFTVGTQTIEVEMSRYTLRWIDGPVPVGTKLYASPIPAPAAPAPVPDGDDFDGDTPHMIRSIEALVDMSDRGKLIPHGLCGNARKLLLASANRLRQQVMPVPEEWREAMAGLVGIANAKGKKQGSPNHCHSRPGIWDDDNIRNGLAGKPCAECAMYDRARAMLQSAEVKK